MATNPEDLAHRHKSPSDPSGLRLIVAIFTVDSLFIVAFAIAIPIGRVAVTIVFVLAFVLAKAAGTWLHRGNR
jgi:hypothetical protein